jgi:ABC-2 type transport system ATP-binding protein
VSTRLQSLPPGALLTEPSPASTPALGSLSGSAPPLLLSNVVKQWRGASRPVLSGVSLTLAPGTCTWIGGRNGAGKTTLLRIVAGLIEQDSGQVHAFDLDWRRQRSRYQRLVSYLPAGDRGLYARLSVRAQLEFCGRIALIGNRRLRAAVAETIERFDLGELAERRVDRLSMGQRQRVRLAMTFLPAARLVLLDEPVTSLDGEGAALLSAAVEELCAEGGAVLWCSPQPEIADLRFDGSWHLSEGSLVAS